MNQMINLPWLSRNLEVIDSTDPTLVGISGVVMDETKRTIIIQTQQRDHHGQGHDPLHYRRRGDQRLQGRPEARGKNRQEIQEVLI